MPILLIHSSRQAVREAEEMNKTTKKKKKENPFLSAAEIEEREAFEKRNFRIKLILVIAIPLALIALWFIFDYATRVQS